MSSTCMDYKILTCIKIILNVILWYLCVLPACQLVVCDLEGEERTGENMELSDGLLLQVNNGEQWCNRWKHPNDDSVSQQTRINNSSL